MSSPDAQIIAWTLKYDGVVTVQQEGIESDWFVDQWRSVWNYIVKSRNEFGVTPSVDTVLSRFPDVAELGLPDVRRAELSLFADNLAKRRRYRSLIETVQGGLDQLVSWDNVDDVIQIIQGGLNNASYKGRRKSHLVDLFAEATNEAMVAEVERRSHGSVAGLRSGFGRFDAIGGLQKQKMVTIIGRSGIGKSWVDLWFVANAVAGGGKVTLYPLEMTLFEVATRLYSIFSYIEFGEDKTLPNFDMTTGSMSPKLLSRSLQALQEKYEGRLLIADVGSLQDPYTIERIEAETESHKPDMIWVDYLTLLKPPAGGRDEGDYVAIRKLSHGIKNIAMRRNVVGGCSAQVNREAVKGGIFLPRLEHISYGDSIGQDSDQVFSLNRKKESLYYSLVKNRGGPEYGGKNGIKVDWNPNEGIIRESDVQDQGVSDDD